MRWKNHELPLGVSIDPEDHAPLLEDFVQKGFLHFELQMPIYGLSPDADAEDMLELIRPNRRRLSALNLCPWSVHLPFGEGWDIAARDDEQRRRVVEKLENIILGLRGWGVRVLTLHPGLEPVADGDRTIRALRAVQSIQQLRDCAFPLGMRLAVEDLPRSCLGNTGEELEALLNAAPGAGCCFDVNHLLREDHRSFLQRLAPRILTTHLSDYDGEDERHWLPGQGIVPFGLVADALQQGGYRGPYLFELRGRPEGGVYDAQSILTAFAAALEKE